MLADLLPSINATCNLTSAIFLSVGFFAIKRKNIPLHRAMMFSAACASVLFLVGYLTRISLTGTHTFLGVGVMRTVYLLILFTHMILAIVLVPMVLRTFFLSLSKRFIEHRRIARWTWPVWIYVSITGVVVYVMLYHM